MKIKQFIGPFSPGTRLDVSNLLGGATFIQIGVEHPKTPSYEVIRLKGYDIILRINNVDYAITERDILEFNNLKTANMVIDIIDINDPYLLINIGYDYNG